MQFPGWTALHHAASAGHADAVNVLLAFGADASAGARDGRKPRDVAGNEAVRAALEPGRVAQIASLGPALRSPRPSTSQGVAGGPRLSFVQAARQSFSRAVRRSHVGPAAAAEAAEEAAEGATKREGSQRGEGSYRGGGAPTPRPPRRSCLAASGALQEEPVPPPAAGEGNGGADSPPPQLQLPPKRIGKA